MQEMVNREDQETKERHGAVDDASPAPVLSTPAAETFTQAHVVTPSADTAQKDGDVNEEKITEEVTGKDTHEDRQEG